jgi:hypothetical protein
MLQKDNILQESSVIVEPQTSVSQASVESVMRAIRQRLKARIALCRQVQALGKLCCNCIIIYLILQLQLDFLFKFSCRCKPQLFKIEGSPLLVHC